jgi:ATP-binding cassette subfamily F protein uup
MNLITLDNISKSYSEKLLLDNVSFTINEGEKIGIIGLNGAGKSTLLKIITGKDEFFDGLITKGKDIRIEYLDQNPEVDINATVLEQVFKAETKEIQLLMKYEMLLEKINLNLGNNDDNNKLIELQSQIDSMNLWNLESEAKSILTKLGITDYNAKMGTLSGGQKRGCS